MNYDISWLRRGCISISKLPNPKKKTVDNKDFLSSFTVIAFDDSHVQLSTIREAFASNGIVCDTAECRRS